MEERADQVKSSADCDSRKAKGEQDQPDERKEHECEEGERPAEN
jgi:hypothetical protein